MDSHNSTETKSNSNSKVINLSNLQDVTANLKKNGTQIVHCHGVFDLLHIGHIRYLQEAKQRGDVLVVSLTSDRFVNKGPGRPAFNEKLRSEALAALECVDYVTINDAASAEPAIKSISPNLYVKGPDYQERANLPGSNLAKEEAAVQACGGKLVFTQDKDTYSSSSLINEFINPLSESMANYIKDIKQSFSIAQIEDLLGKIEELKILVVGETIIDEYCFSEAIGKSGKEPVLAIRLRNIERYAGGTVAIANHVAGFCKNVTLLSSLGEQNSYIDLINKSLKSNIKSEFVFSKDRPTILKRRYLEFSPLQKLFEVYVMEDQPLKIDAEQQFNQKLDKHLKDFDLVIVADYGHALIGERAKQILIDSPTFLALNTQVNAGNRGFHTISCYSRADYISLSESELRIDFRRRTDDLESMVKIVTQKMGTRYATITRGKNGVLSYSKEGKSVLAPAFDQAVVDRVGSGDAVLSVTSPLAYLAAPLEIMAFIGNIVGSMAVRTVGHSSSLNRSLLSKAINALLK